MEQVKIAVDGKTKLCGLIGNPVEHTISPMLHHAMADACKINLAYLPFLVEREELSAAVEGAYALGMLGVNVTVPYKKDVIPFLKETEPMAAAMESVNTLVRIDGGYRGYNTDMSGLYRAMQEDQVFLADEEVIVLGAGGVGRAVAFLCAMKGAKEVYVLNRNAKKAQTVAQEVNERCQNPCVSGLGLEGWRELPDRRYLCIQATSVGLFPDSERACVEEMGFYEKIHTGYDLIYRPADTKFMRLCKKAGARSFNGLKMLVYQGVEAFEMWNQAAVPKEALSRIFQLLS